MYYNIREIIERLVEASRVSAFIAIILSLVFLLVGVGTSWRNFRRASMNCITAGGLLLADAELMRLIYDIKWILVIKMIVSAIVLATGILMKMGLWSGILEAKVADQNHAERKQSTLTYWFVPLTDRLVVAGVVQMSVELIFWFICKV